MAYDPFAIRGAANNNIKWNFSKPKEPDYKPSITGDIVEIRQVQAKNHMTGQREVWPDGNPKLNMCFVLDAPELGGEVGWVFSPKSAAADAVKAALAAAGLPGNSWANMAQMNVTISTQDGVYGSGHPRPWQVTINGPATAAFRGLFPFEPKPEQQQQQPQQQYQQQPVHQQPQFDNPRLQQSFQQATQAVRQAQFDVPQQRQPQQYGNFQQNPQYQQMVQASQPQQLPYDGYEQVPYADADIPF